MEIAAGAPDGNAGPHHPQPTHQLAWMGDREWSRQRIKATPDAPVTLRNAVKAAGRTSPSRPRPGTVPEMGQHLTE